jgi:mono/diheme cytochrome c family protein
MSQNKQDNLRCPRRRRSGLVLLSAALPLAGLMIGAHAISAPNRAAKGTKKAAAASPHGDAYSREIAPLVDKYCISCHTAKSPAGEVSLAGYKDVASVLKGRKVWERVSQNVSAGHMPPAGMPQMTMAERDRMVGWIDATITQADCNLQDPGRVTLRRLNRAEYNNTVRDLLGVSIRPADEFPSDDVGYGFDNIGDVLSISPLLMEKYMTAAERVARAAIVTPEGRNKPVRFEGGRLDGGADYPETRSRELGPRPARSPSSTRFRRMASI